MHTSFHPDANWRVLKHTKDPVQEPSGQNRLVGPTAYKENEQEVKKYNFDELFDRPPFMVMAEERKINKEIRTEKKVIEYG